MVFEESWRFLLGFMLLIVNFGRENKNSLFDRVKTKFRNFFVSGLGVKTDLETFELVGNPSIVPMNTSFLRKYWLFNGRNTI